MAINRDLNETVMVTGAAGFVGSHTVTYFLEKGYTVRAMDRKGSDFSHAMDGSISNSNLSIFEEEIRNVHPDHSVFKDLSLIVHCAGLVAPGRSLEKPSEYLDVNVMGLIRILEGARNQTAKQFVNISSGGVYGHGVLPFQESACVHPLDPYCLSKWIGEEVCRHWTQTFGMPTISLRLFHPYGPRSTGPINLFVQQRKENRSITLYGDGLQQRDFTHIRDVVRAIDLSATLGESGEIYNVCSGQSVTMASVAEMVGGRIKMLSRPDMEVDRLEADNSKLKTATGWEPSISLREGIDELLSST